MNNQLFRTALAFVALLPLACGGIDTPTEQATLAHQEQSLQAIGTGCSSDSQCASGLCWSTDDSYPVYNPSWEQGSSCTVECVPNAGGDAYCRQLAAQYNAPRPNSARCLFARAVYDNGQDGAYYVCDLVKAGLGSYWSE